jgi:hypothetical protein
MRGVRAAAKRARDSPQTKLRACEWLNQSFSGAAHDYRPLGFDGRTATRVAAEPSASKRHRQRSAFEELLSLAARAGALATLKSSFEFKVRFHDSRGLF